MLRAHDRSPAIDETRGVVRSDLVGPMRSASSLSIRSHGPVPSAPLSLFHAPAMTRGCQCGTCATRHDMFRRGAGRGPPGRAEVVRGCAERVPTLLFLDDPDFPWLSGPGAASAIPSESQTTDHTRPRDPARASGAVVDDFNPARGKSLRATRLSRAPIERSTGDSAASW